MCDDTAANDPSGACCGTGQTCHNDTDFDDGSNDLCCPNNSLVCGNDCCPPGGLCYQGNCCVPDCTNAYCGQDDGCGGTCDGYCVETGHLCTNDVCVPEVCSPPCPCGQYCTGGACVPLCSPGEFLCGCSDCCGPGEICNPQTATCGPDIG